MKYTNIAFTVLFSIAIACAAIVIVAIFLVQRCKFMKLNGFIYFSWCIFNLFTILGFLLSIFFFPISIAMFQTCDILNTLITDPISLQNYNKVLVPPINNYMETCLYGDGDIVTNMTGNSLNDLTSIANSLNTLNSLMPGGNTSVTIPLWRFYVRQYVAGTAPVAVSVIVTNSTLNSEVNYNYPNSKQSCKQTQDTIQLSSTNCTDNKTILRTSDSSDTSLSNGACIGIADFALNTIIIQNRYTSALSSCGFLAGNTVNMYNQYTAHYLDVESKFNAMLNNNNTGFAYLTNLDTQLTNSIYTITTPIKVLNDSIGSFMNSLNNPQNGLLSQLNCTIIGSSLRQFHDNLCYGFVTNIFQLSLIIAITSIIVLVGNLFAFCLAKRLVIKSGKDVESKLQTQKYEL